MALNQIVKLRYRDGTEVALVDWSDRPIYSTVEILHGTTTQEIDLFQYTEGDTVPAFAPVAVTAQRNATQLDTNLSAPGAMASTEEMLVFAIRPEVFRLQVSAAGAPDFSAPAALSTGEPWPTPTMLSVLALRYLLLLEISEKDYSQGGFGYYNWGGSPMAFGADAGVVNYGTQGLPSQEAVRSFSIPQHIGGQEKFSVRLLNPSGAAVEIGLTGGGNDATQTTRFARLRVYLDGLKKRPTS